MNERKSALILKQSQLSSRPINESLLNPKQLSNIYNNDSFKLIPDNRKLSLISSRYSQSVTGQQSLSDEDAHKKLPNDRQFRISIIDAIGDRSHPDTKNKNIYDLIAMKTEKFRPIAPQNTYLVIWHGLIQIIIFFYIFEVGLLLGYGLAVWSDILNYLIPVNITFIIILATDCFVSLLKAYYEKGLLVTNHRLIAKRYFPVYFILDVVAIISITLPFATQQYLLNWIKLLFLPKLITVYRIDKQYFRITQLSIKLHTFYLLSRLILLLVLGSHYLGIFFFMIDYYVYQTNYYGPNTPNLCWIYNASAFSQIIILLPWYGQYEYTMYFSIGTMTTIAFGDITPLNPLQTLYIIFALLVYTVGFAYILSEVLRILMEAQASKFQHTNTLLIVTNMMRDKMITEKLQIQVRKFYQKMWKQQVYRNRVIQKQLIDRLPQKIRNQLYTELYQDMFKSMGLWNPLLVHTMISKQSDNNYAGTHLFGIQNRKKQDDLEYKIQSLFMANLANSVIQERLVQGHFLYYQNQKFSPDAQNSHSCYYIKPKYKNRIAQQDKFNINRQIIEISVINNTLYKNLSTNSNRLANKSVDFGLNSSAIDHKICGINKGCVGIQSFYNGEPRNHSAKVVGSGIVYRLPRQSLLDSLQFATPFEKENTIYMCESVDRSYCYLCEKRNDHSFLKCPYATYQPDIYKILSKQQSKRSLGGIMKASISEHSDSFQSLQNSRNKAYGIPSIARLSEIKESRKRRLNFKFNTLKNVQTLKNNRYRVRNKYQMLISNPYYSKLIKNPLRNTKMNRSSTMRHRNPLSQSYFMEDDAYLEKREKKQSQQFEMVLDNFEIRQIKSEEQQENGSNQENIVGNSDAPANEEIIKLFDSIKNQKVGTYRSSKIQEKQSSSSSEQLIKSKQKIVLQKQKKGIFSSSSSSSSSSDSSKDLQNYMKQTQHFIRHLERQQQHEQMKQQLKRNSTQKMSRMRSSAIMGSLSIKDNQNGLLNMTNSLIQNNSMLPSRIQQQQYPVNNSQMMMINTSLQYNKPSTLNNLNLSELQLNLSNIVHPVMPVVKLNQPEHLNISEQVESNMLGIMSSGRNDASKKQYLEQMHKQHEQELEKLQEHIEHYRNSSMDLANITDQLHLFYVYRPQGNYVQIIEQYNILQGFNAKRRNIQKIQAYPIKQAKKQE